VHLQNSPSDTIKGAKPYLDNSWYKKMKQIIKENKGKDPEFRTYGL
jgi:hypothetical protein